MTTQNNSVGEPRREITQTKHPGSKTARSPLYRGSMVAKRRRPITEEELLSACQFVSLVIDRYGDSYWPILSRLEYELDLLRSRRDRLKQYLPREKQDGVRQPRQ